jgi:hypothetical protein
MSLRARNGEQLIFAIPPTGRTKDICDLLKPLFEVKVEMMSYAREESARRKKELDEAIAAEPPIPAKDADDPVDLDWFTGCDSPDEDEENCTWDGEFCA